MHKKEGQLFSFDILFAVIVFILATIAFYFGITTLQEPKQPFAAEQDFIWGNLENIDDGIGFLEDSYIINETTNPSTGENPLEAFINQEYAHDPLLDSDLKQKILSGFIIEESDFCLYFTEYDTATSSEKIQEIGGGRYGVGPSRPPRTPEQPIITNCNDKNIMPSCDTYEEALIFTRPVFRIISGTTGKIIKLNILVCKEPE